MTVHLLATEMIPVQMILPMAKSIGVRGWCFDARLEKCMTSLGVPTATGLLPGVRTILPASLMPQMVRPVSSPPFLILNVYSRDLCARDNGSFSLRAGSRLGSYE